MGALRSVGMGWLPGWEESWEFMGTLLEGQCRLFDHRSLAVLRAVATFYATTMNPLATGRRDGFLRLLEDISANFC